MGLKTDTPTDPFASFGGAVPWHVQPELQHFAKAKKKVDDDADEDEEVDEEDDDDDDSDDDEEDDDEEDDDDPKELARKLKIANAKLARNRKRRRKEAEEAKPKKTGKPKKDDDDDEEDDDDDSDARIAEVERKADDRVKKIGLRAALKDAGLSPSNVSLLLPQVDLADLDVDDDGEVDGLDEAIDDLKDTYPDLFSKRRRSSNVNGDDERSGATREKKPMTATQRQVAQLTGKKPRR